jgi:NAD(P)-dependent dehydrogenase (short-subunit alcohol dehydrogenase family)
VADALDLAGYHVVAIARSQKAMEQLDDRAQARGSQMTIIPLDLKAVDMIDGLAAPLAERFGRIDALFANAGMFGSATPLQAAQPRMVDDVIRVNLLANWRLIRALDPLLRAASKAGLDAMVRAYADEVEHTRMRVNLIDPGPMQTALRAAYMPGEDKAKLPSPAAIAAFIVDLLRADSQRHGERIVWRAETGLGPVV